MSANNLMQDQQINHSVILGNNSMNLTQGFQQSIQYPSMYQNMNGSTFSAAGFMPNTLNLSKHQNENQMFFKYSQISTAAEGNTMMNQSNSFQGISSSNDLRSSPSSTSQQQQQTQDKSYIEHLDLSTFKIEKCKTVDSHNQYRCHFYHNQMDRRRPCQISSDLCDQGDRCSKETCPKAHNQVEVHYSKDQYKKKFCKSMRTENGCEYGNYCSFAHSEQDILIDLIHLLEKDDDFYMFHYKTVMCPFIEDHQRDKCEYYHNTQDFRRRPDQYSYEPETCKEWPSKDKIQYYEKGCKEGYNCNKCHGWKELDYHPRVYKTKGCKECKKQQNCPNYHNEKERRKVPESVSQKIFRLVPKNSFFLSMKRQQSGYQNSQNNSLNTTAFSNTNNISNSFNLSSQSQLLLSGQLQLNSQNLQSQKLLSSSSNKSQQPELFFINSNNSSYMNHQGMNGNHLQSGSINSNRNQKSQSNGSQQIFQIFNDQNANTSNFTYPLQLTVADNFAQSQQFSQFNQSFYMNQKQFSVVPKDQQCESQFLNQFEQSQRLSESTNLHIIKESNHTSNVSSSIVQNSMNNWVSNNQGNESEDESRSPSTNNRKKSCSDSELNKQIEQFTLNDSNGYTLQFVSHSQNDLNKSDKQSNPSSHKKSFKSAEKKPLKRNSKKQIYIPKEDDNNSIASRNQLSDEQKFSSYNSQSNNSAQLQTANFNLFSHSDEAMKQINNILTD